MDNIFPNVTRSLSGQRWRVKAGDGRQAEAMSQRLGVPDIIGRLLTTRGVDLDTAPLFLNPTLKDLLPDPLHLIDMPAAVERLTHAVVHSECIAVFGDYDVDGATSSALLIRFLCAVGCDPQLYIPDRLAEGYGPNTPALLKLKEQGADVVVTVDCGTSAFAPFEAAHEAGLDVIVIDHHEATETLPKAVALVNPKRVDDPSPHTTLAAVGVTFLLVVALNRALRQRGWYTPDRPEPDLRQWLDLVALGTVCDVVPLIGLNRAFVTTGLKVMARRSNPGLAALLDIAQVKESPSAFHLGYMLGPRVNAGGRVGRADLGARLLVCDDPMEAGVLALRLHELNGERREIEAAVLREALERVEARPDTPTSLVMVAGSSWHPGVIGIVASRLKERYGLPTCVVAIDDAGMAKGSGRSVTGIDLGQAILAAREAGILEVGGGHAMAVGFSLPADQLPRLEAFLADHLATQMAGTDNTPTLEVDGVLNIAAVTPDLLQVLEQAGPFGAGNETPHFIVPNTRVSRADVVGQGHVRLTLSGPSGQRLKAIAFRSVDTDLGAALLTTHGNTLHVMGTLKLDTWQGREECQMIIRDAAYA